MSINKIEMQDDKGNTYYPHTDASIVKYGDSDVATELSESVKKTTTDVTYYVNSTSGNDLNNGLTNGTAFKTITKAISMIPQVVNHIVNINISAGAYNELAWVTGFAGNGRININGGTDLTTAINYITNAIYITKCTCTVALTGFASSATSGVNSGFYVGSSTTAILNYCVDTVTSLSKIGILADYSFATVSNCQVSNKNVAIVARNNSKIYSDTNSGNGSNAGLQAVANGTIGKNSTQPSGTTLEIASQGGVIR
ncbi:MULTISPECIES: hypothetical protein [Clostridium]|uniref:hypothetical protein n=1 Tax=Clostridium TaxID=1485 RepID=UPI000809C3ED|nr:hypothetical protein [Clostridium beijerinckii]OCB00389.1 hypothetical protein BGS1_15725 [Clostridium beijerinckii]